MEEIHAEVNYYRDSVALLRARLYRRGIATTPRLEELQRKLDSAERRLRTARPVPPPGGDGAPLASARAAVSPSGLSPRTPPTGHSNS
jgi:hypothetical protein